MQEIDLSPRELRTLAEEEGWPRLSFFLPTHVAGPEVQQDSIRLENLRSRAERMLLEDVRRPKAEKLLGELAALRDDDHFWQHQGRGLALFVSEESTRYVRTPSTLSERLVIGDRFHVRPLLAYGHGSERYRLLALSRHHARVFEADRDEIRSVGEYAPADLGLYGEEFEPSLQFHTETAPKPAGRRPARMHGHGGVKDAGEEATAAFLRKVDAKLHDLFGPSSVPLVVAAVREVFASFRRLSKRRELLADPVEGNYDEAPLEKLHEVSWKLVEKRLDGGLQKALGRYRELGNGNGERTLSDLEPILQAVAQSRVETLFVAEEGERRGSFDRSTGKVSAQENDEGEDLLDLAATEALRTGAEVYCVGSAHGFGREGGTLAAAILRY